jgi:GntR family transcriptional regulator / MocR family aminotransferase
VELHISLAGRGDLAARIYRGLRDAILDGRLRPGDRLPATRELARSLVVSRNTVATAYERLTAEGFLTARVGSGTYVAEVPLARRPRRAGRGGLRPRPGWTARPRPVSGQAAAPRWDFRVGIPDPELFPFDTWRRLVNQELRLTAHAPGTYAGPAGHPALRVAIARYVGLARSVPADPDDVLVTSGTQQALDLIARVLVSPGDTVAVEDPGYLPAHDLFVSLGARVVGVPVDAEGLVVDELPAAKLVYTTPSHQFPLGGAMSLPRRLALLAWADRYDAAVVEDDYDSEFRFADRPLDPLYSLDSGGRVIYLGTFSKTLLPALRIGYAVVPASLRDALHAAKQLTDWHTPVVTQVALARFADSGELARHIRRATTVYAARRTAVLAALGAEPRLDLVPSVAGLHVCATTALDADAITRTAAAAGIGVEPLSDYCFTEPRRGFVLGYGAARDVDAGLAAFRALLSRP